VFCCKSLFYFTLGSPGFFLFFGGIFTLVCPLNFREKIILYRKSFGVEAMEKKLSAFTVASVYVGTVVGAGFASGQEVLQFFGYFGLWGFAAVIISTVLFILFGMIILELGNKLKAKSFRPVVEEAGGRLLGRIIDVIIVFFLFGFVVVMNAGAGAIFMEQFGKPAIWGNIIMAVITLGTVLLGLKRVIDSISFVAPFLLVSILLLSILTVSFNFSSLVGNLGFYRPRSAAVSLWPISGILYSSYNIILAIPVLAPMGALAAVENLRKGAILGGLGLGLGSAAITAGLLAKAPGITTLEVPMIAIAGDISPLFRNIYSIVLLAEVYTTAVSSLYGFGSRLAEPDSINYKILVSIASLFALILARFGFSNLVNTLFPLEGAVGLILLGALAYYTLKKKLLGFKSPFVFSAKPFIGKKMSWGKNKKGRKK